MPRAQREWLILQVAGRAFARGGYHSTSMDEIAELAGVSKPMVYAYFNSKEQLYVAYINLMGGELLERLLRATADNVAPLERLRRRVLEFLAFVEENRDGWKVLFSEISSSRPLAEEVADLRAQIAETVRRMVESSIELGPTMPPAAPDAIAHAIVGAGESLANWWLEHPDVSREELASWYAGVVQAAVAAMFRGARLVY